MTGHFTSSIEFQMSLLLFVSLAGHLLATRIHQSAVVGEILVGLIIGPSVLGWITYTNFVQSVAHLGAIILLFVVGLEFKLKDVFNFRYGIIALAGVIIPWIGGYWVTKLFGFSMENAIFTGTALTATSIAITANVLREMNKLQTEAAKAIIGAAVIDDVLSLLALSLSEQIVKGDFSFLAVGLPVLKAVAFLVVAIYLGVKHLCRFVENLDRTAISQKYPEFVFIFVMMIAFLYAMFAEMIGLSSIVGAFIAGISLEGAIIRYGRNYKHGAEYLHIIFASIFFVSLGILVDTHVLTSKVVVFLIALTVVAVFTKVIGCFISACLQRVSFKDSAIIGFGMSPRGEVAMIVGLIGLNQKFITQEIYAAIIFMSLITTIITPLVLRQWFYPAEK